MELSEKKMKIIKTFVEENRVALHELSGEPEPWFNRLILDFKKKLNESAQGKPVLDGYMIWQVRKKMY